MSLYKDSLLSRKLSLEGYVAVIRDHENNIIAVMGLFMDTLLNFVRLMGEVPPMLIF